MSNLLRSTFIYTLGNIIPQAVAFFLLPLYTEFLTPYEYGIINSMLVIQAILAIFFSLALDRSIIRIYWDYKNEVDKKTFLSTISITIFILSSVFLATSLILQSSINKIFPQIDFFPYYFFTIITTFCFTVSILCKSIYRLKDFAIKYFIISIAELLLTTICILYFLVLKDEMSLGVIKGKMIGFLILLPIYFLIIIPQINFRFDFEMLKKSFSFSLPIIPTLVAAWILGQSDKIFIADVLSLNEVGIFSLSKRIAGLIGIFAGSFMLAYHPIYFKLANSKNQISSKLKLSNFNYLFSITIIFFTFILLFISEEIILIFLNERYFIASKYIPALSIYFLLGSLSSTIIGASFQQSKKMKQDMYIGLFSAFLTLSLYFLLIERYKLEGLIFSLLISNAIIFLVSYFYSKKFCFFIPFKWKEISLFSSLLIIIYMVFHFLISFSLIINLSLKLVVIGLILFILLMAYKKQNISLVYD